MKLRLLFILLLFTTASYCQVAITVDPDSMAKLSGGSQEGPHVLVKRDEEAHAAFAKNFFSTDLWFPIQQILIDGQLVMAIINAFYILIVPVLIGQVHLNRDLEPSWNDFLTSTYDFVKKSIDPTELSFMLMNIREKQCRQRAICQMRKAVSAVPMIRRVADSYMPSMFSLQEQYQTAIEAGEASKDCYAVFPKCENDPYENLVPDFLKF